MQQQPTRQSNEVVNPLGGLSTDKIEPVQIYGSDRPTPPGSIDATINPRLKPPPPPNEFERYVENALGRKLPRFGADLLLPSNRDYAVPATATVPPDYILNVGDIVTISLTGSTRKSIQTGAFSCPKSAPSSLPGFVMAISKTGSLKRWDGNIVATPSRSASASSVAFASM